MVYDIRRVFQKMAQGARTRRTTKALTANIPDFPKTEVDNIAKMISVRGKNRRKMPSFEATQRYARSKGYKPRRSNFVPDIQKIRNPDVLNWNDQFMLQPDLAAGRAEMFADDKLWGLSETSRPALLEMIRRRQLPARNAWNRLMTSGRHGTPNLLEVPSVGGRDTGSLGYRTSHFGLGDSIGLSGFGGPSRRDSEFNWFGGHGTPGFPEQPADTPLQATKRPSVAMTQAADLAADRIGRRNPQWVASVPNQGLRAGAASPQLPSAVIEGWKEALMGSDPAAKLKENVALIDQFGGKLSSDGSSIKWADPPSAYGSKPTQHQALDEWLAGFKSGQQYRHQFDPVGAGLHAGATPPSSDVPGFPEKLLKGLPPEMAAALRAQSGDIGGHGPRREYVMAKKRISYINQLLTAGWDQPLVAGQARPGQAQRDFFFEQQPADTRGIPKSQLDVLADLPVVTREWPQVGLGPTHGSPRGDAMRLPDATVTLTHPGTGDKLWKTPDAKIYKLLPDGTGFQQVFGKQVADATTGVGSIEEHGIPAGAGDPIDTRRTSLLERIMAGGRSKPGARPPRGKGKGGKGRGAGAGAGLYMIFNALNRAKARAGERADRR